MKSSSESDSCRCGHVEGLHNVSCDMNGCDCIEFVSGLKKCEKGCDKPPKAPSRVLCEDCMRLCECSHRVTCHRHGGDGECNSCNCTIFKEYTVNTNLCPGCGDPRPCKCYGPIEPRDTVDHPPHYNSHPSGVECITVVEHMGFNLGNAVKYIWRADEKGNAIEDLSKAKWYIEREIKRRIDMIEIDVPIPYKVT